MTWWQREKKGLKAQPKGARREIADELWVKCSSCGEILFRQELVKQLWVCPKCRFHFRVGAHEFLGFLLDEGSFAETHRGLLSEDPLEFRSGKDRYRDKLLQARKATGLEDAVITGTGAVEGRPVTVAVMDFGFMGGSMGSVVGEKVARAIGDSLAARRPLIIVSQSGGARMQESILSLMQMAKTSALLGRLRDAAVPFISLLTHPTTGGVTASFAMLGDLVLAEPRALVGFAGPRVIQQTIQSELPEGFQTAEFLLEHGMVDRVVDRHELRRVLDRALGFLTYSEAARGRRAGGAVRLDGGPRLATRGGEEAAPRRATGGGPEGHDASA